MKFEIYDIEELLVNNGIHWKNIDVSYEYDFADYRDYICHSLQAITISDNGEIDIEKVNKITKILLDTNDEVLRRVAYNSFWFCYTDKKWLLYEEAIKNSCRHDFLLPTNASPEFETERLIIRPNNEEDAKILSQYIKKYDKDNLVFYWSISRYQSKNYVLFSLIDKKTNKVIGNIGLYPSYNQIEINTYELQYYIVKKERRKGYAKEAVAALLKQIKDDKIIVQSDFNYMYKYESKNIKIEFLRISCDPFNKASKNLAISLGFEYAGNNKLFREVGNERNVVKECIYTKLL